MRPSRNTSACQGPAPQERAATTAGIRRLCRLLVPLVLLTQVGCFWVAFGATAAGVAGYAYWQGKVCHAYAADLNDAVQATKTALAELGMPILKEEPGDGKAVIRSRAADGTRVNIKLRREMSQIPSEGAITEICVRVGAFGDHPLSGRVLYQISAHLVAVPPPGSPAPPTPGLPPATMAPPPGTPGPMAPPLPPGATPLPAPRTLPPGTPPPPAAPVAPAGWAPVNTGEPPLSK